MHEADSAPPPGKGRLARSVVLVGLMGAGKSAIGRRLANRLGAAFTDSDRLVESRAGMSVPEIFQQQGEPAFRTLEHAAMADTLLAPPQVIAAGGGAVLDPRTRENIRRRAVSIWLRASLDLLVERCARNDRRPLLRGRDIRAVLESLMAERHPVYAEADITIDSVAGPHDRMVTRLCEALEECGWLAGRDG